METGRGGTFTVDELESEDCPASSIDGETLFLIDLLTRERHERDATGASLFGPVSADWPAWYGDAVYADELTRKLIDNARNKAEMEEMKARGR